MSSQVFFFSDFARLVMVGPLILVRLSVGDFVGSRLLELRNNLGHHRLSQVVDDISKCWVQLAACSAPRIANYDELEKSITFLARQLVRVGSFLILTVIALAFI